jgi:putative transposase
MNKEEFIELLSRQRASGLTIRDFCRNEVCAVSSFYRWKSKYGLACGVQAQLSKPVEADNFFAPVCFPSAAASPDSSTLSGSSHGGESELVIELPQGVKIRLSGETCPRVAMELFSQILHRHVLPE